MSQNRSSKTPEVSYRDLFFGIVIGLVLGLLFAILWVNNLISKGAVGSGTNSGSDKTVNIGDTQSSTNNLKVYNTEVQDWELTSADGTTFHFKTPSGYFSLSDQYADTMESYYGMEFDPDATVCVGNASQQLNSTILINASPLSTTKAVVEKVYADDDSVDLDDFRYSEAYEFMTTGSLPEDIEGVEVKELDKITSSEGITYRVFQVDRDTEYYTDDTMTGTEIVHSVEICAYSENEDSMEVLLYMQEFDLDAGIALLKEFLN